MLKSVFGYLLGYVSTDRSAFDCWTMRTKALRTFETSENNQRRNLMSENIRIFRNVAVLCSIFHRQGT